MLLKVYDTSCINAAQSWEFRQFDVVIDFENQNVGRLAAAITSAVFINVSLWALLE